MWRIFIIFNNDEHSAENGHSKFVFVLEKINTSNNKFCEMMLRKPHTYSTLIAIAQNHYLSFVIIFSSISKLLIWYCSTVIKYWTWTNSTQIKREKTNQMKKNWNKRKTKKTNIIYCLWLRDHTHRDSSSCFYFTWSIISITHDTSSIFCIFQTIWCCQGVSESPLKRIGYFTIAPECVSVLYNYGVSV